jgi:hypothetical protein
MLRISIRELMAFTLAAAMGIAWLVEHSHLQAAVAREVDTRAEADSWQGHSKGLESQIEQIKKELSDRGLELTYSCGFIGQVVLIREIPKVRPIEVAEPVVRRVDDFP